MDINSTDICNMALSRLGKYRISSMDEQTEAGRQCKLFYEATRQRLLREYNWGFAKRKEKLTLLDKFDPDWPYVYAYPNQCICVRKVFTCFETEDAYGNDRVVRHRNGREDEKEKFDIIQVSDNVRGIGCDLQKAWLEYTYDVVDTKIFPPDFVEALTHLLAYNMALSLTGNSGLQLNEYQQAQSILSRAFYTNAAEKVEKPSWPENYYTARM